MEYKKAVKGEFIFKMPEKPDWLRVPYYDIKSSETISGLLKELNLNTVCIEAGCPNKAECFSNKTATFMIMGINCTRNCTFCNVGFAQPEPVDPGEPQRVATAVKKLSLSYVVITSVTRDDLADGGAEQFAKVIKAIKKKMPETSVEVLIPDLPAPEKITDEFPAVISHNIETVKSLYQEVRPGADYERSLQLIKSIKRLNPDIHTKSGLMLGLGETYEEILSAFDDLHEAGCDFLTIGQYLSPTRKHYKVREYINPSVFSEYKRIALKKGFRYVASGPFVRSSYKAESALK